MRSNGVTTTLLVIFLLTVTDDFDGGRWPLMFMLFRTPDKEQGNKKRESGILQERKKSRGRYTEDACY